MFNPKRFSNYLRERLIIDIHIIENLLLQNDFVILNNRNSHNYNQFLNEDGILRFNNPSMHVNTSNMSVNAGVSTRTASGNTINFEDIGILLPIETTKLDVLAQIELLEKQIREKTEELDTQRSYIDYMVATNRDIMIGEEYDEWKKECVKKTLKPTTFPSTVKV